MKVKEKAAVTRMMEHVNAAPRGIASLNIPAISVSHE